MGLFGLDDTQGLVAGMNRLVGRWGGILLMKRGRNWAEWMRVGRMREWMMGSREGTAGREEELVRVGLLVDGSCWMWGTKLGREDRLPYSSASSPPHPHPPAPSPPNSPSSASLSPDETAMQQVHTTSPSPALALLRDPRLEVVDLE